MRRRLVLGQLAAATLAGVSLSVRAQAFPTRPVRIVVAYPAGGSPDTVARIVGQYLGPVLGQPIVVENVPGSSGIAAMEALRNQPADGHTLLMADAGHWAINRATRLRPPYDYLKDVKPVALTSTASLFLAVHESFPADDLNGLVAVARARPSFYAYGSSGVGSLHHLAMEAFKAGLGLDLLHVPYKGTGESVPALAAGQVAMAIASYRSLAPFASLGKLKIIAATTREPSTLLPRYPAMATAGLPDFHFPGENGLFVADRTPRPALDMLALAVAKVLATNQAVAQLQSTGVDVPGSVTSSGLAETVRRDVARYARAVKSAGLQPA